MSSLQTLLAYLISSISIGFLSLSLPVRLVNTPEGRIAVLHAISTYCIYTACDAKCLSCFTSQENLTDLLKFWR